MTKVDLYVYGNIISKEVVYRVDRDFRDNLIIHYKK